MRLDAADLSIHSETLLAVLLGAVLATLSGLVATQFEAHLRRRERERDAALLFGELLSTLKVLIDTADRARGQGDPYGPFTIRMWRAVRRELDIYDRNREALYDLRQAKLRFGTHSLMVRFALALEGVLDSHEALGSLPDIDAHPRAEPLRGAREQTFGFLIDNAAEVEALLAALTKPAGRTFDVRSG